MKSDGKLKVAIIGGTSGIGLATYHLLKEKGYAPIATGRHKPEGNVEYAAMDVSSEDSVRSFFSVHGDGLYGVVYCAGKAKPKTSIDQFDPKAWNDLLQVNVTGAILCLKYAYPQLKKSQGRVVIVNSVSARRSSQGSGFEYTMSKSALSGLVKQLSQDWANDGILINSVYPGATDTPMLRQSMNAEKIEELLKKIPLGKIGTSEDVARAIEFLISKENRYMTGSGVDISGGIYLSG